MTDGEYTLFKLFVSTYKNEYCLGKVANQCIDYLLIASMDQEFFQFLERWLRINNDFFTFMYVPNTQFLSNTFSRLEYHL